jgi:alanyl-tRNA synthetase
MTVRELREKYLAFFLSKGHFLHPSGSLVPYWVNGQLDESLLFNGAGMIQFKPYFRGVAEPPQARLTTCQKCLRTGDIEEVGDDSHLTFFEMLGNFSFGDYFKQDAIAFSWEFLTDQEWLALDPKRLAFTVFEEDDEAETAWSRFLLEAGMDPSTRVFRLGEDTNYWPAKSFSNGPPGPCGPNSEMFYWTLGDPPQGPYSREDFLRDEGEGKWLEIWNDVFISYEWAGELKDPERPDKGYLKTGMPDLPFKSIDTGMGLERTAAVLAGFRSVYDTDAFQPIFRALEELGQGRFQLGESAETTRAMRIVADHVRSAVFCIADGIFPGNTGRGYVLRRLIRRAVLKAQKALGFNDLVLAPLSQAVIAGFGGVYPELTEAKGLIAERLEGEEEQFRRTLEDGVANFEAILGSLAGKVFPGDKAFFLYETFGFPLEVTQELAEDAGLKIDTDGYEAALARAQELSRGAGKQDAVYGAVTGGELDATETLFLGYDSVESDAVLVDFKAEGDGVVLALDQTPFYAESGGQVSDLGQLGGDGFRVAVTDVKKKQGVWLHYGKIIEGELVAGSPVRALVDSARRKKITLHHTATHLMHAALRQVLGTQVAQAGSLVNDRELRFDFTHREAMSLEELRRVEEIVNEEIWKAQPVVTYADVPLDDAKAMGAMALFGEKYSGLVRVVQVGGMAPEEASFSRELCGGIHVGNTGEIGLLKILHESSAASGIRRISAVAGPLALAWLNAQRETVLESAHRLKTTPDRLVESLDKTLEALKEEKKKRQALASSGMTASVKTLKAGGLKVFVGDLGEIEGADAQLKADQLVDPGPASLCVLATQSGEKFGFVVKAGPEAVAKGIHAGNLAREVAKLTGGGGGGKPNFATAGGKDLAMKDKALEAVAGLVKEMVKG